jgi:hypothetical protein
MGSSARVSPSADHTSQSGARQASRIRLDGGSRSIASILPSRPHLRFT